MSAATAAATVALLTAGCAVPNSACSSCETLTSALDGGAMSVWGVPRAQLNGH